MSQEGRVVTVDTWEKCYQASWQGIASTTCMAHPAKFSKGLIFRIVEHAIAEGWIAPGQTVLDPFGGVALGALPCLLQGIHWVGVELEPRFAQELGPANLELWRQRYGHLPGYGEAVLLCGDSRRLASVIQEQVECCVSSPPYAECDNWRGESKKAFESTRQAKKGRNPAGAGHLASCSDYGTSPGQLGTEHGTTFWSAARTIVAQTYAILKPGGRALWVVKAYVRDGQRVDFPGDWQRLCESLGFVTLHEHHAMLTEDHGTQAGLFGAETDTTYVTAKKSFFRRLAEKSGSPPIDWETIYCMQKGTP